MPILRFVSSGALLWGLTAGPLSASIVELSLNSFGSDPVPLAIVLDDTSTPGFLSITGTVGPDPIGDIRGLFLEITSDLSTFDLQNDVVDVAGVITARAFDTGSFSGGNNIEGEILNQGFTPSLAFSFGTSGIGGDDIQTFTLHLSGLTLADVGGVAARVTSIGSAGSSREGSDKLFLGAATFPGPPAQTVPEPASVSTLGLGLLGLAAIWSRRRTRS